MKPYNEIREFYEGERIQTSQYDKPQSPKPFRGTASGRPRHRGCSCEYKREDVCSDCLLIYSIQGREEHDERQYDGTDENICETCKIYNASQDFSDAEEAMTEPFAIETWHSEYAPSVTLSPAAVLSLWGMNIVDQDEVNKNRNQSAWHEMNIERPATMADCLALLSSGKLASDDPALQEWSDKNEAFTQIASSDEFLNELWEQHSNDENDKIDDVEDKGTFFEYQHFNIVCWNNSSVIIEHPHGVFKIHHP